MHDIQCFGNVLSLYSLSQLINEPTRAEAASAFGKWGNKENCVGVDKIGPHPLQNTIAQTRFLDDFRFFFFVS